MKFLHRGLPLNENQSVTLCRDQARKVRFPLSTATFIVAIGHVRFASIVLKNPVG